MKMKQMKTTSKKKTTAISDARKLKGDLSSNTPERRDSRPKSLVGKLARNLAIRYWRLHAGVEHSSSLMSDCARESAADLIMQLENLIPLACVAVRHAKS
jgi:hypothetical protein